MAGRIEFGFNFNSQSQNTIQNNFGVMRIYIFGDFSAQSQVADSDKKIIRIDIDNFDQVIAKLQPTLKINSECELTFSELDDFHPDNIYSKASVFNNLKRLKKELENPQTSQQASDEIRTLYQAAPEKISPENESYHEETIDTIERLLGQPPSDTLKKINDNNGLDKYLSNLFKPYSSTGVSPETQVLIAFIDSITETLMQSILHSKDFQELESVWRSTFDLLFNEETDERQSFYLVDMTRQALFDDIHNNETMQSTIAKELANTGVHDVGEQSYTLMVGNYEFSVVDDIDCLGLFADFAKSFNSSFVAAVDKAFINNYILADNSLEKRRINQLWNNFRSSKASEWIVLTYPRILLRIPYGNGFEETDDFPFEEFREGHQHEQLLWGNSAFACARLLIRQYLNPQFSGSYELNDLPAYTYEKDGEQVLQACAEELMNEEIINKIFAQGIIPFISFRNRNSVRLLGFQSTYSVRVP